MVMSQRQHTSTVEEIDEHIAVDIANKAASSVRYRDRDVPWVHPSVGFPGVLFSEEVGRARSRQLTVDIRMVQRSLLSARHHDLCSPSRDFDAAGSTPANR